MRWTWVRLPVTSVRSWCSAVAAMSTSGRRTRPGRAAPAGANPWANRGLRHTPEPASGASPASPAPENSVTRSLVGPSTFKAVGRGFESLPRRLPTRYGRPSAIDTEPVERARGPTRGPTGFGVTQRTQRTHQTHQTQGTQARPPGRLPRTAPAPGTPVGFGSQRGRSGAGSGWRSGALPCSPSPSMRGRLPGGRRARRSLVTLSRQAGSGTPSRAQERDSSRGMAWPAAQAAAYCSGASAWRAGASSRSIAAAAAGPCGAPTAGTLTCWPSSTGPAAS